MGFVWVHVESFLHSVASPFHSSVTRTAGTAGVGGSLYIQHCNAVGSSGLHPGHFGNDDMPWSRSECMTSHAVTSTVPLLEVQLQQLVVE